MASAVYPAEGGGGGLSTVETDAPVTGDGSVGDPVTMANATDASDGAMSSGDKFKLDKVIRPARGTNLTDADQTLQPATDKASEYVQLTALTANRSKTLGTTDVVTGTLVRIVRQDSAAFTLAVVNGGASGGTLFTFAASPTEVQGFTAFFNGSDWVAVGYEYLNPF